jgi:hypothetical protein
MRRLIAAATMATLLLLAPTAAGVTKNGITPISPKAGDSVPAGKRPTFKLRYSGPGQIWVHVCKSRRKDADGLICPGESIGRAKKTSSTRAQYKAKFFDFPEFWLNTPGTYYWQAHRIACEGGDISDCRQEGPIVKFKVK